ncbi:Peptide chain release factor 1-like, mitochondrial, partial [Cichlidogyrus casuarinus]
MLEQCKRNILNEIKELDEFVNTNKTDSRTKYAALGVDCKESELDNEEQQLYSLAQMERTQSRARRDMLEDKLIDVLLKVSEKEEEDADLSVVSMEFLPGAGGQEAGLFASDLLRMYRNLSAENNWQFDVVDALPKSLLSGDNLFSGSIPVGRAKVTIHATGTKEETYLLKLLSAEAGVHRVQRVPVTGKGKIHTSTVAVVVLSAHDDISVQIEEKDLKWESYKPGGPGGQHANKTDSAARLTHLPTGTVINCQNERNLHENKRQALELMHK